MLDQHQLVDTQKPVTAVTNPQIVLPVHTLLPDPVHVVKIQQSNMSDVHNRSSLAVRLAVISSHVVITDATRPAISRVKESVEIVLRYAVSPNGSVDILVLHPVTHLRNVLNPTHVELSSIRSALVAISAFGQLVEPVLRRRRVGNWFSSNAIPSVWSSSEMRDWPKR